MIKQTQFNLTACLKNNKTRCLSPRIYSVLLLSFWVCFIAELVIAQIIYNPNDERFKQLALEKAIWAFKESQEEFQRVQQLQEEGYLSTSEYTRAERGYRVAQVEMKQALLALTQEAPYLLVDKVIRYRNASGEAQIDVFLHNAGQLTTSAELDTMLQSVAGDLSLSELFVLSNIFVSLKDSGTIIALPYEHRIARLSPGESVKLTYTLLRDLDVVTVSASYLGRVENKRVLIQRQTGQEQIQITAAPRAQECEFGQTAVYDLQFERGDSHIGICNLEFEQLPDYLSASFTDIATGARVSKLIFPPATSLHTLRLEIFLPDRGTSAMLADTAIHFTVVVREPMEEKKLGLCKLELVPRGVGKLEISAYNWLISGTQSTPPLLEVSVRNTGSIDLKDIRWEVNGPTRWQFRRSPENIHSLKVGDKVTVKIQPVLPLDELSGDYEVELRFFSFVASRRIESDTKTFRVEIKSSTAGLQTLLILILAVLLIGIVVYASIRLSRR